jgi:hypothetical protein
VRLFEVIDPDQTAQSVADFLRGKGQNGIPTSPQQIKLAITNAVNNAKIHLIVSIIVLPLSLYVLPLYATHFSPF